ncbi:unnamed protein product [Umbelopsis vinacea]
MTENNAAGISSHRGNIDEKFVPIDPVDNEKIQVEEEETKDQFTHSNQFFSSSVAIGGTIGTGIFLSSGSAVAQAGPAGALIAYIIVGIMVYFIVTSLGEMSAYLPVPGAFTTFGARFVDPAIGFMLGWNYCLLGQSLSGRLNM